MHEQVSTAIHYILLIYCVMNAHKEIYCRHIDLIRVCCNYWLAGHCTRQHRQTLNARKPCCWWRYWASAQAHTKPDDEARVTVVAFAMLGGKRGSYNREGFGASRECGVAACSCQRSLLRLHLASRAPWDKPIMGMKFIFSLAGTVSFVNICLWL